MFHPPVTMSLMLLYWAECVVIGGFNFIKLYYIKPEVDEAYLESLSAGKRAMARSVMPGVFLVHYGMFLFMCFGLLLVLADRELGERGAHERLSLGYYSAFLLPVALLAVSHGVSFFRNFLGKREYEGRTVENQMFRPYRRVALMMAIVFGGIFLVAITGLPKIAALLFVAFKLLVDLRAHFRDRDSGKAALIG